MNGASDLAMRVEGAGAPARAEVVMPVRRWEDFLPLGVAEIREDAASSVQVARRLGAMLDELRDTTRPERGGAADGELARLDAGVAESWSASVDVDLAGIASGQGAGSPGATSVAA